jgi:hypothetical protein
MSEKKEHLKSMLTNIIHDRNEEAAVDFHNFLKTKMRELSCPEVDVVSNRDRDGRNNEE